MKINNYGNLSNSPGKSDISDIAKISLNDDAIDTVNKIKKHQENEETSNKCYKWDLTRMPLGFFIDKCNNEKFLNEFTGAVEGCFQLWAKACDDVISFHKINNPEQADIILNWSDTVTTGRNFEAGHNNLKIANNKIEKAEITIIIFPEIDKNASPETRIERVRRTALHELGHALGLNHSDSPKDIMFHRGITNNKISVNDIKRLIELYSSKAPIILA